jgi:hypothetical protein
LIGGVNLDAILPAAGKSVRMRGLPKFLLPCDNEYLTLLEFHIGKLLPHVDTIWIPTRPDLVQLIDSIKIESNKVVVFPFSSLTMNHSVDRVLEISSAKSFQLIMPDTFFAETQPYNLLDPNPEIADVAIWKIRPEQKGKLGQVHIDDQIILDIQDKNPACNYEYSWGALTFSRKLAKYINIEEPHIGYALKSALKEANRLEYKFMRGQYYDCGTPSEYIDLLRDVLS